MAISIPGDGVPQGPGMSCTATGTCWGALQVLPCPVHLPFSSCGHQGTEGREKLEYAQVSS